MNRRKDRHACKDCPEVSTMFVDADGFLLNCATSNRPPRTVEGIRRTRYKPPGDSWLGYYRFFGEQAPGLVGG